MGEDKQSYPGEFLGDRKSDAREERSIAPWFIAGGVVLLILSVLVVVSLHSRSALSTAATGSAAYAGDLKLADLELSQSSNLAGSQITYVDGQITNQGNKIVTGVGVRTIFHDAGGNAVQTDSPRFQLIRTREPYVDVEPLASNPIKPGETRAFRMTFEHVPDSWDQKNPTIEILSAATR